MYLGCAGQIFQRIHTCFPSFGMQVCEKQRPVFQLLQDFVAWYKDVQAY
jgi:hypothetical protein